MVDYFGIPQKSSLLQNAKELPMSYRFLTREALHVAYVISVLAWAFAEDMRLDADAKAFRPAYAHLSVAQADIHMTRLLHSI